MVEGLPVDFGGSATTHTNSNAGRRLSSALLRVNSSFMANIHTENNVIHILMFIYS